MPILIPDSILSVVVLFALLILVLLLWLSFQLGIFVSSKKWRTQISRQRREAVQQSRQVLRGQLWEEFVPYLPGFPFHPQDARFLGSPVDFVIFPGLNSDSEEVSVVFLEVKSGRSQLNQRERRIRDAVKQGRVLWQEYFLEKELEKG